MAKKNEQKASGGWVTIPEMVEMKAHQLNGLNTAQIAREVKRNRKTVQNSLAIFEQVLPNSADLKNKIIERIDEIKEQMMQNAENICLSADMQVKKKIFDKKTSALDAAKISQMYGSRLGQMAGFDAGGVSGSGDEGAAKSANVVNFINTFIIQKKPDDNINTRNEKGDGRNDKKGTKNCIEGVVSERPVFPF